MSQENRHYRLVLVGLECNKNIVVEKNNKGDKLESLLFDSIMYLLI